MVFAAATDERTLFVFPAASDAIEYCEGIDVEDDGWLFWDEAGAALVPKFLNPNHRGRFTVGNGNYRLVSAPHSRPLAAVLAELLNLRPNPYFPDFAAVSAHLANASRTPQHGA